MPADRLVSKEVLRTALEAEGILNSRPITTNDAGDIKALIPKHFLLMRPNQSYEDAVLNKVVSAVPGTGQLLLNTIYQSLTERKTWKEKKQNLKKGAVVLLAEPNIYQYILAVSEKSIHFYCSDEIPNAVSFINFYFTKEIIKYQNASI